MASQGPSSPPGYAWDWLARQRLVWVEAARRLATVSMPAQGPHPDVPDWSSLLSDGSTAATTASGPQEQARDWSTLRTRADVVAALRTEYAVDAAVRTATDGAVTDLAFLGRLDVPLEGRGVRSVPRGMRWWWTHLGGAEPTAAAPDDPDSSARTTVVEPRRTLPLQLQLADVMAGYGDGDLASDPGPRVSGRTTAGRATA